MLISYQELWCSLFFKLYDPKLFQNHYKHIEFSGVDIATDYPTASERLSQ